MKCEKTDDFFVMRVQISVDLSREQRGKSAVFSPPERVQLKFHLATNIPLYLLKVPLYLLKVTLYLLKVTFFLLRLAKKHLYATQMIENL